MERISMADKYSQWLYQSRIKREISFQLGKGITRLQSPFSYQRVKGLVHLMQFFKVLLFSEDKLLFLNVQTEEDLCVMKQIFNTVLFPKQSKANRTSKELTLAVELVAGMILMYPECKIEFMVLDGLPLILQFLTVEGDDALQVSVLHLLMAVLADSEVNQQVFEHADGYEKIEHIIKQRKANKELRAKCAEFLLFCIKFFKADTKLVRLFGDHRVKQLHKMMSIRRDEQLRENLHAFIEGFESGQS